MESVGAVRFFKGLVMRFAAFLALFLCASAGYSTEQPKILGISHVAVKADDLEKSVAFYRDFLGFGEQGRLNYPDGSLMLSFVKVSDEQWIEIFDAAKLKPDSDRLYQIALRVENAQALLDHLAAKGYSGKLPQSVPLGQMKNANFTIKDPNGYLIEFVQYLPEGRTALEKGKCLSDARVSDRIVHAGIVVKDYEATRHFYGDQLGFQESWRGSANGKELAWVHLREPQAKMFVELMLESKVAPHFCLEVSDVEKAKEKLENTAYFRTYGKPLEIKTGKNRKRQINLYDPSGVRVELMEPNTVDGQPVPSSDAALPKR